MKKVFVTISIVIWAFLIMWVLSTYERTKVADYDVKFAHYEMSSTWNYCPICGECLRESKNK